ncbi:synaptotagmin-15-like isoform X2 [Convolutriloba macropyga]|uniref:synaptotagmin-15-like isoform X2 n=1 Tax=Convolutriloba macropyga TaxID=536237 RepID=UPI003F51B089
MSQFSSGDPEPHNHHQPRLSVFRIDMFDAGIPFKIPTVSAARNRNYVSPSPSSSLSVSGSNTPSGRPSPQNSSSSLSPGSLTAARGFGALGIGGPGGVGSGGSGGGLLSPGGIPVRRVSTAGDFYIPGEQTPIGKVNPELYQNEGGQDDDSWECVGMGPGSQHLGRLWFNVEYLQEQKDIQVTVLKAFSKYNRDTPSTYDTFVRVYLLPAASPDEEPPLQKTKTQKKSAMPTFDETFTFKMEPSNLAKHQLKFCMLEFDRSRKRFMTSFTVFSLKDFDVKQPKKTWQYLKPSLTMDKFGADLQLSICHEKSFNKLNVTILDTRNVFLPSHRLGFSTDHKNSPANTTGLVCWVKTSLRKGDKELKSKSTRNLPVPPSALDAPTLIKFNQQLQFTVKSGGGGGVGGNSTGGGAGGNKESSDLGGNTWLLVELFIRTASLKDELVGEVSIGPGSFASGSRVEHWMTVCDQPNQQIRMWHKLDYFPTKSG